MTVTLILLDTLYRYLQSNTIINNLYLFLKNTAFTNQQSIIYDINDLISIIDQFIEKTRQTQIH